MITEQLIRNVFFIWRNSPNVLMLTYAIFEYMKSTLWRKVINSKFKNLIFIVFTVKKVQFIRKIGFLIVKIFI